MLDSNFALGCGLGTDYPLIHIFQCMLGRTSALTDEVPEPIKFLTITPKCNYSVHLLSNVLFEKPLFPLPVGCSNVRTISVFFNYLNVNIESFKTKLKNLHS